MRPNLNLKWLPRIEEWEEKLMELKQEPDAARKWRLAAALAKHDLDLFQTAKLDRLLESIKDADGFSSSTHRRVRIALIGTGTLNHLAGPIRIACARRNLDAKVFVCGYNLFQNELFEETSQLYAFAPDVLILSIDARYAHGLREGGVPRTVAALEGFWSIAQSKLNAFVIQQTCIQIFPDIIGNNEHRLGGSPQSFIAALNRSMLEVGDAVGVAFLDAAKHSTRDGITNWYDPQLWYRSKQEIHPGASLLYGDHVGRIVATKFGNACKCVVLDLDNTLWGGVIGDDGLDGIKLGQGSPEGEAFVEFQKFILAQRARGLLLAVCSKNNQQTAMEVFEKHPEMLIRAEDVAAFSINWNSKGEGLKRIAAELNIGTDALLFLDDNPAERDLVRRVLPEVAVPELPGDAAYYLDWITQSGYLEAVTITAEDVTRAGQYQANQERERLREASTDMEGYLADLNMKLEWARVDSESFARVVQLVNKTNQFNLTTRRYSDADMMAMMQDSRWITIAARLKDKFGDNGIVALGFIHVREDAALIDNWVMSCRVFGRQVEDAMMNLFVDAVRSHGINTSRLKGTYKPTAKNSIVENLYARMGFSLEENCSEGSSWSLDLSAYSARPTRIWVEEIR